MEINDLKKTKANEQNYLQATEIRFLVFCSTCIYEINYRTDATLCETKSSLYKIYSKMLCRNIVNNLKYCKYCVGASKHLDITDEFERIYNPENNEDCVSVFEKGGDGDDVTFAAKKF